MIKYQKNIDQIVLLTLDMEGQARNIINHKISDVLVPVLDRLEVEVSKRQLKGVIITSAKKQFLEGGDLDYIYQAQTGEADFIYKKTEALKSIYRRLEKLGVPIVATINGTATGAGYELTLACHHRIAINQSSTIIGFPEVRLGLIPGGGAITRLTWLLGIETALQTLIKGQLVRPKEALELGLIDELVNDEQSLIEQARQWICEHKTIQQPWDIKSGIYTKASVKDSETANWIASTMARMMKKYKQNQPAITVILDIVVNAISMDFDTATKVESRYFTKLAVHPVTKNMIKTFWLDKEALKKGIARPKGFGRFRPRRIGVIGAGQMGCAITAIAASAGLEVVLKDVSKPVADRGKLRAQKILEKKIVDKKLTKEEFQSAVDSITATNQVKEFDQCDLVLEAVFENVSVKNKVIKEASNYMDEYAMFASNTSSLSISRLAKASTLPNNFIGLKFFHPVENTRIVEIIRGVQTSDETVAKAIDFVRQIKKLPIVIQDRRGFFTTRVMEAYGIEGMALLKDGCHPSVIELTAINAGMKSGPLAMMDEISIANTLMFEERKKEIFKEYWYSEELSVMQKMVNEFNRSGKISKVGFYDYENDHSQLWEGLITHFYKEETTFSQQDILERLLFVQALEAMRCLESGVIDYVEEINIASVFAWGFSAHKGGVLQFVNSYGISNFLNRTKELCKKYGKRFAPPALLLEMEKAGNQF